MLDLVNWLAVGITATAAFLAWRRRAETAMFQFAGMVASVTCAFRLWVIFYFEPPNSIAGTQQVSILTGPILLVLVVIGFVGVAHYHTKNGNGNV
jgi:hypothetical protein